MSKQAKKQSKVELIAAAILSGFARVKPPYVPKAAKSTRPGYLKDRYPQRLTTVNDDPTESTAVRTR